MEENHNQHLLPIESPSQMTVGKNCICIPCINCIVWIDYACKGLIEYSPVFNGYYFHSSIIRYNLLYYLYLACAIHLFCTVDGDLYGASMVINFMVT